jgi:hypothetical protein
VSHQVFGPGRLLAVALLVAAFPALRAADERILPSSFSKEQRENLLRFLKAHETPTRYVPKGAKIVDAAPPDADSKITASKEKPIKQYTIQIKPHRPVPGEEQVTRADVYYYRPNPAKGKQGITIKYTVDLKTGKQIGETEVLTKAHTPVSREEVGEAVEMVKEKSEAVKKLHEGRQPGDVRWEYLQMKVNRKSGQLDPGDRVLRIVFTATPSENEKPPEPVRVLVNLTKDLVILDKR